MIKVKPYKTYCRSAYTLLVVILTITSLNTKCYAESIDDETFTPHYAFSNYFGAGLYSSTGQDITIFNMPFTYEPEQEERNKYRIRLPVSLGFYNFDLEKIDDFEPIEDAATLTLTAGIEFDHWVTDKVKLVPFIDLGASANFSDNDYAFIYGSGITSYTYFQAWEEEHIWIARLQRAGYRTNQGNLSDGFSSFELGVDLKWSIRGHLLNRETFFTTYMKAYWYLIDIAFDPSTVEPSAETNAQELGVTMGFTKPLDFSLFTLDRIGLGFRYSHSGPNIIHMSFDFPLD